MSSRRARVKLAPNLGISRNKAKPAPLKPKIVVKSDTDNSDTEHISDLELDVQQNNVDTVEESTKLDHVVKDKSNGVGNDTDVHIEDLSLLLTSPPLCPPLLFEESYSLIICISFHVHVQRE